jgi:formylglycine-generating enzyme required for sulfatase activity
VNWYEAYAFCIWDGGFLPTAAETEYATAAGQQEWEYPWGSTPPGSTNHYAIGGCNYPDATGACSRGIGNIAPVGTATLGAGLWGQLDLLGEMGQWVLDWDEMTPDQCIDCAALTVADERMTLGCSFESDVSAVQATVQGNPLAPFARSVDVGIRCARTP